MCRHQLVWHFADEKATFARGRVLGHIGLPLNKSSFDFTHLNGTVKLNFLFSKKTDMLKDHVFRMWNLNLEMAKNPKYSGRIFSLSTV